MTILVTGEAPEIGYLGDDKTWVLVRDTDRRTIQSRDAVKFGT
jgi:hypothetical protein